MLLYLLCLGCGGQRFADSAYVAERSAPWNTEALPEGRTVVSEADTLVVRYPGSKVATLDHDWNKALLEGGFSVVTDHSRGESIVRTYGRADTAWALSITAQGTDCTVRLADLGAL